jgi:hypothetical protein
MRRPFSLAGVRALSVQDMNPMTFTALSPGIA